MKFKLTAKISHKEFQEPLIKEFFYEGNTLRDALDHIVGMPKHHIHNLLNYRRTAFKDDKGVKHNWNIKDHNDEMCK